MWGVSEWLFGAWLLAGVKSRQLLKVLDQLEREHLLKKEITNSMESRELRKPVYESLLCLALEAPFPCRVSVSPDAD